MTKLAVLGTSYAAREVLEALLAKGKAFETDVFVARAQVGEVVDCIDKVFAVHDAKTAHMQDYDLAVFVGDEQLAKDYAHKWAKAGVRVINATDALSDYAEIPYVVAGQSNLGEKKAVNVPHRWSLPVVKALECLAKYGIKNVRLTQLIGADIAGQDGMSELYNHTRRILMNENPSDKKIFPKTLAFNVIPQAGAFIGEETEYEWQMSVDVKRILGEDIKVQASCAMVPVFVGEGAFVDVEFGEEITPEEAVSSWKKAKGVLVVDTQKDGGYAALTDAQGEAEVFVSRIRSSSVAQRGLSFWVAGDVNKVSAANISELIVKMLKKEMK